MKKPLRFFAALLALAMCIVPIAANADILAAVTLYNNVTVNCTVLADELLYCKFTPTEDGVYTFVSLADNPSYDLDAQLYCGDDMLTWDHDSGEYNNFKLTYNLTKGVTYNLCVDSYWETTISCPIKVAKAEKDYLNISAAALTLDASSAFPQDGKEYYYEFTPDSDGYYNFNSKDCEVTDSYATLYRVIDDCLVLIATADDSHFDYNFSLTCQLIASEKYVIKVKSYTVADGTEGFVTVTQNAGELDKLNFSPVKVGTNSLNLDGTLAYAFTPSQNADYSFKDALDNTMYIYEVRAGALISLGYYSTTFIVPLEANVTYAVVYNAEYSSRQTELIISLGGQVSTDFELDEENLRICGVPAETHVLDFKAHFTGDVAVLDAKGGTLMNSDTVTTGSIAIMNGVSYGIVVKGDVNGDGKINSTDFMQVRRRYLGLFTPDDIFLAAADVNGDGKIASVDFMRIRSHYLGRYDLYA